MLLAWLLACTALGLQVRPGLAYPEGRPDCSVVGQWLDHEGNRTIAVTEVKPGLQDYLKLQPSRRYVVHYRNNWDVHSGEVSSRHGDFLLAGVVPSVQQTPEHLLYLTLACYRRELWTLAIPYKSSDSHSSAFFRMTPMVAPAVSDDPQPRPSSNISDENIQVDVSMWAGHPNEVHP